MKAKTELQKLWNAIGFQTWLKTAEPAQVAVAMDEMASHPEGCDCASCKPASKDAEVVKEVAKDAKASDARKAYHDALDRMLDSKEAEQHAQESEHTAADEDLKKLFAGKDEAPTDKKEDANEGEVEGDAKDEDPDNAKSEEEEETDATDEAVQSEAAPVIEASERPEPVVAAAVDSAFREGQMTILKALKPVFAASKDKAMKAAFDQAMKLTKEPVKVTKGSYSAVAAAAAARANDSVDPIAEANAAYAKIRNEARNGKK